MVDSRIAKVSSITASPPVQHFLPTAGTTERSSEESTPRDRSYFYHSLFAGICSGTAGSILCAPLDLLRTRLQVWGDVHKGATSSSPHQAAVSLMRQIWRTEGFPGYFRGLTATLWTVPAFWGVYFPLYEELKHYGATHYSPSSSSTTPLHPSVIHMGAAVSAGAVADVLCNPMFVARTRLQTEAMHSTLQSTLLQTIKSLYREGGILVFWRGMTANLLGLSHVAVQFPVYEQLKIALHVDTSSSPFPLLMASALSKMVASLLTYPHEVIRSRMMDARNPTGGLLHTMQRIYHAEGVRGFYAGLPVSLVRVIPNTAVTFCVYEWTVAALRKQKEEDASI